MRAWPHEFCAPLCVPGRCPDLLLVVTCGELRVLGTACAVRVQKCPLHVASVLGLLVCDATHIAHRPVASGEVDRRLFWAFVVSKEFQWGVWHRLLPSADFCWVAHCRADFCNVVIEPSAEVQQGEAALNACRSDMHPALPLQACLRCWPRRCATRVFTSGGAAWRLWGSSCSMWQPSSRSGPSEGFQLQGTISSAFLRAVPERTSSGPSSTICLSRETPSIPQKSCCQETRFRVQALRVNARDAGCDVLVQPVTVRTLAADSSCVRSIAGCSLLLS